MKRKKAFKENWREALLLALVAANLLVWVAVHASAPGKILRVYFLDVGQGDAILIDTPSHRQVLIDGGRNKKVLSELGRALPFGDKILDIVIETHPDADHIGGLPEVVNRYGVALFVEPGVESENSIDNELHARLKAKSVPAILARRGEVINFGDGAKLTILFPNQDVSHWETNDASVVARLDYGNSSFLFTGDSTIKAENIILKLGPSLVDVDVLKAGHHGSRTSTSQAYAQAVSPEYAVISAGKDNTYGHPHKEVLDILNKIGVKIIATEDAVNLKGMGTIEFETDGKLLKLR